MSILVKTVRIAGFRGLKNIEVDLEPVTVLTGMNNCGKTSFLKALQIALGGRQFISQDDFYISGNDIIDTITIDVKIIAVDDEFEQTDTFDEAWETLFTENRIKTDSDENSIIPIRTIITFDSLTNTFKSKRYILPSWVSILNITENIHWHETENGRENTFFFDEIPFFYVDAQRDIIEDIKIKTSYLGRMLSKIDYGDDIEQLEKQIKLLNEKAVQSSPVLQKIKDALKQLDTAMSTPEDNVEITPFTKKLRDLHKGFSIYYNDQDDSFSMEYHGMGTRSWSSLLTLKAFINILSENAAENAFFPILAVEEPEAHLHPNAQKKLYTQINEIAGQKIISTHSPYIAASAKLEEIRNLYKSETGINIGRIDTATLLPEEQRKINRQVVNTRGELFFSKAIVFFEGETEEQALPIFAEKYFGKTATEMAIDFIGVGGHGNYLPFIRVVEGLHIPWFILSDGEQKVVKSVKKTLKTLRGREVIIENENNVFVLDHGCDFEKHLIEAGYLDEIKTAFEELRGVDYLENQILSNQGRSSGRIKTEEICDKCEQNIYEDILRDYDGDEGFKRGVYDCMTAQKTKFGPVVAQAIIDSDKDIPAIIKTLFEEVRKVL